MQKTDDFSNTVNFIYDKALHILNLNANEEKALKKEIEEYLFLLSDIEKARDNRNAMVSIINSSDNFKKFLALSINEVPNTFDLNNTFFTKRITDINNAVGDMLPYTFKQSVLLPIFKSSNKQEITNYILNSKPQLDNETIITILKHVPFEKQNLLSIINFKGEDLIREISRFLDEQVCEYHKFIEFSNQNYSYHNRPALTCPLHPQNFEILKEEFCKELNYTPLAFAYISEKDILNCEDLPLAIPYIFANTTYSIDNIIDSNSEVKIELLSNFDENNITFIPCSIEEDIMASILEECVLPDKSDKEYFFNVPNAAWNIKTDSKEDYFIHIINKLCTFNCLSANTLKLISTFLKDNGERLSAYNSFGPLMENINKNQLNSVFLENTEINNFVTASFYESLTAYHKSIVKTNTFSPEIIADISDLAYNLQQQKIYNEIQDLSAAFQFFLCAINAYKDDNPAVTEKFTSVLSEKILYALLCNEHINSDTIIPYINSLSVHKKKTPDQHAKYYKLLGIRGELLSACPSLHFSKVMECYINATINKDNSCDKLFSLTNTKTDIPVSSMELIGFSSMLISAEEIAELELAVLSNRALNGTYKKETEYVLNAFKDTFKKAMIFDNCPFFNITRVRVAPFGIPCKTYSDFQSSETPEKVPLEEIFYNTSTKTPSSDAIQLVFDPTIPISMLEKESQDTAFKSFENAMFLLSENTLFNIKEKLNKDFTRFFVPNIIAEIPQEYRAKKSNLLLSQTYSKLNSIIDYVIDINKDKTNSKNKTVQQEKDIEDR